MSTDPVCLGQKPSEEAKVGSYTGYRGRDKTKTHANKTTMTNRQSQKKTQAKFRFEQVRAKPSQAPNKAETPRERENKEEPDYKTK